MILVADSSALIALSLCDSLPLLETLYTSVRVPEAVFNEVIQPNKPQSMQLKFFLHGKVIPVNQSQFILMPYEIDLGEQEAMLLYKQLQAQALLVDDLHARKVAHLNQIKVIGSLGVLLKAKDAGLIPLLFPLISRLANSGIFYSDQLIQTILQAAGELL
ncbi:MAG: DUF3368 domain-containing protein [Candidatus Sericytochromatia bacterium]|nr:DUF3368 domain-containing protein [Candidatus Sericytochromatia bacterium]